MTDKTKLARRGFLRNGSLLGLGVLAAGKALAQDCRITPAQMEGPFYPVTRRDDVDADLTQVEGRDEQAAGEVVVVRGTVRNLDCEPVAGAVVEIWQANTHGKYDHPGDDNPGAFDPNFQYWARVTTGADGTYSFKTIYPGLYPGRTRHIHYRITAPRVPALTTQLYFAGEARNASDGIYANLTSAQRRLVTTTLATDDTLGVRAGTWDITVGGRGLSPLATPEID